MTIAIPSHLSDSALIAEVTRCARDERHATAQLVAHLAELDLRRLYLGAGQSSLFAGARPVVEGSRHVAAHVRRGAWIRDGGRCAFVGASGHRCSERGFLEYHHVVPYAVGGEATTANIQLRCRAHNGYEADLFFGTERRTRGGDGAAERSENHPASWGFSPVPERPQRQHGAPRSAKTG